MDMEMDMGLGNEWMDGWMLGGCGGILRTMVFYVD